jgi:hypothetical protein
MAQVLLQLRASGVVLYESSRLGCPNQLIVWDIEYPSLP